MKAEKTEKGQFMIIVIDHEDSFTYNLVHYFRRLDPEVAVHQSAAVTAEEIRAWDPDLIVLSPGPGRPPRTGAGAAVLEKLSGEIPVFGVCLGHQMIVEHFGGQVQKGKAPVHGKVFSVDHDGQGIFSGISSPTPVARYHSLVADPGRLPACLVVTATTRDGEIMGVRHEALPVSAVQFHPESIATEEGFRMIRNVYEEAKAWKRGQRDEDSAACI